MPMIEAYKIGIDILITGDASPKMREFVRSLNAATKATEKFNAGLSQLNEHLSKTGIILDGLMPKMEAFSSGLAGSFRAANVEMSAFNRRMGESAMFRGGPLGYGGFGGGRGGGGHFEREFGRHAGRDIGGAAGGILGGGLAMVGGPGTSALMALFGLGMAGKAGYNEYSNMQAAIAQLQVQGFGPAANAALVQQARTANIPGISRIHMLEAISDAAVVTKDPKTAGILAPTIARMLFANRLLFGQLGQTFTRADERRLLQASEIRMGSRDPAVISSSLNFFQRALVAEGGPARLPTTELTGFMRRGQTAARSLSDEGFARIIPAIQAMKGAQVGRQVRGFESGLLSGTLSKAKRAEWERIGILHKGKIKENLLGQTVDVPVDVLSKKDLKLLSTDVTKFIQTRVGPAIRAAGFITKAQQTQELFRLEPQAYTGFPSWALANIGKTEAMVRRFHSAYGIQPSFRKALNLNVGNIKQMTAAFSDLGVAFGKMASPGINRSIKLLTIMVKGLTDVFSMLTANKTDQYVKTHLTGIGVLGGHRSIFDVMTHSSQSLFGHVNPVKPVPVKSSSSTSHVYMDGRKVGEVVQKHMMKAGSHPPSHGSYVDFRQTLVPTQLNSIR